MSFHHKSDARDLPLDNVWITQIGSSLFSDICYFVHLSGIKKKKEKKRVFKFLHIPHRFYPKQQLLDTRNYTNQRPKTLIRRNKTWLK